MFSALTFLGIFEPEAFFTSRVEALSLREKKIHWKMLVVMSFSSRRWEKKLFFCVSSFKFVRISLAFFALSLQTERKVKSDDESSERKSSKFQLSGKSFNLTMRLLLATTTT